MVIAIVIIKTMYFWRALSYFTSWGIFLLIGYEILKTRISKRLLPKEETICDLIRFNLVGGILLYSYFLIKYGLDYLQLARLPFEILFHIIPFIYVSKHLNCKKSGSILPYILIYVIVIGPTNILQAYFDPYRYLGIVK